MKKSVTIHSDGACEGNPGPGGWAAVLQHGAHVKEVSGGEPATTNNRMELRAAIEAFKVLNQPCRITFFTDSEYLRQGITEWIAIWKRNGWKTRERKPVRNDDLWRELDAVRSGHEVDWKWLKGHAGHVLNERCDLLARTEIGNIRQQFGPEKLKELVEAFRRERAGPVQSGNLF